MAGRTVDFTTPATEAQLQEVAARLRERNFDTVIVDSSADARAAVLERLPDGIQADEILEPIGL